MRRLQAQIFAGRSALRRNCVPKRRTAAPTIRASDDANAYLTELTHLTEKLDARVYVREQAAGFGVGQQLSTEDGTRKFGADGRYRLTERLAP